MLRLHTMFDAVRTHLVDSPAGIRTGRLDVSAANGRGWWWWFNNATEGARMS
jgi:hypothetical protein